MIDFFNNLQLRRKLVVITILVVLPVIIIITIVSITIVKKSGKLAVEKQVTAFGDLTASFILADVLYNDREAVKASLENFNKLPSISYAAVLNNDLEIISSYGKIENNLINYYFNNTTSRFEKGDYLFYKPITYKTETLGTLFIIDNNSSLQEIINKIYIGIIITGIIAFLVLIYSSSFVQRLITEPIINLVKIIEEVVKTQNYSKRVTQNRYQAEIGILYDNFNKMLVTIDETTVSQNYLDNVMGSLAEMVLVLDEDGKINTINKAVTRLTSYTINELKHQLPTVLLKYFEEINQDGNQEIKFEASLQSKNATTTTVVVSVTSFINNEGLKRTILSMRDITERKEAEEKLKYNFSKLEQTNKELQELSYILSHDLKTPIRGIGSLVTMMREDFEQKDLLEEKTTEYFELIQKRVMRMSSLINGILEFSKIGREGTSVNPISLKEIVEEVIEAVIPEHFEVNVLNELPTINFNQTQAYQIFQNLISNAVKYNDKSVGKIDISWKDLGNKYQFKIKDNGVGIPSKYHDRIFKVFQVLESQENVESTGIGLAIVKKIIDNVDSRIWVDSNYETGVAFVFELPK